MMLERKNRVSLVRRVAVLAAVGLLLSSASWAAIWYVDAGNTGGPHNGTSWATAYADIDSAVTAANLDGGGDVWVAAGTYTSAAAAVVTMRPDVHIYGGFAGTESPAQFDQRDPVTNVTVIHGQNVRRGVAAASPATLDGFTITNGYHTSQGGGLVVSAGSPTIANCVFRDNTAEYGGAIYIATSGPTVTNCAFIGNNASESGGAVATGITTAVFTNCLFAGNRAHFSSGGAMRVGGSTTALTMNDCVFATNNAWSKGGAVSLSIGDNAAVIFNGCAFIGNAIVQDGGAIDKYYGTLRAYNCVFVGNAANYGGAIHCWGYEDITLTNCTFRRNYANQTGSSVYIGCDELRITNTILWEGVSQRPTPVEADLTNGGLLSVGYSNITGGYAGTGNMDADPVFRPAPSGTTTGLSFDTASFTSTLTDSQAAFTPGALAGLALLVEHPTEGEPANAYYIVDNTATAITVWGDVTTGGSTASPKAYEVLSWRLRGSSPCVDAGRDTNTMTYGNVTTDFFGEARGYDGLGDGPTGPPAPGDGSDYDIGAHEYLGDDPVAPDLEIQSFTFSPDNPTAADVITLTVKVRNIGTVAAGASKVRIEVQGEATPEDYVVPALDPGENHTVTRDVTLPAATGYIVVATADIEGVVAEGAEDNNTGQVTFDVAPGNPYDINLDGFVNAIDVQIAINAVLSLPYSGNPDVNRDLLINAVDVQLVINAALGLLAGR